MTFKKAAPMGLVEFVTIVMNTTFVLGTGEVAYDYAKNSHKPDVYYEYDPTFFNLGDNCSGCEAPTPKKT